VKHIKCFFNRSSDRRDDTWLVLLMLVAFVVLGIGGIFGLHCCGEMYNEERCKVLAAGISMEPIYSSIGGPLRC
jgi:hypothetical protein